MDLSIHQLIFKTTCTTSVYIAKKNTASKMKSLKKLMTGDYVIVIMVDQPNDFPSFPTDGLKPIELSSSSNEHARYLSHDLLNGQFFMKPPLVHQTRYLMNYKYTCMTYGHLKNMTI